MGDPPRNTADAEGRFLRYGRQPDGSYRIPDVSLPRHVSIVGDGQIGGKARGLLFVLQEMEGGNVLPEYQHLVRLPRSTVLTTRLFDDFMESNDLRDDVQAGCRLEIDPDELRERFFTARFPDPWKPELVRLLNVHRGPLVVRSSSVMEDDANHSFAGIYLSEFLANRGSDATRLERLIEAVKAVYASTFGINARAYRKRHHLPWEEEKMAILIQDMVGSRYSHDLFYPLVAGVAFSRNYYPWSPQLSPEEGTVRLVVGTGTRAVGREYARVFSLARPQVRPEGSDVETIVRHSQETVDVLDLRADRLCQRNLSELDNPLLARICSIVDHDGTLSEPSSTLAVMSSPARLVASFDRLISGSRIMPFTPLLSALMKYLEDLLEVPVDVEFAVDFPGPRTSAGVPQFNLLQIRPLGARFQHRRITVPPIPSERLLLECRRVLGNGVRRGIRHVIYVDPSKYRPDLGYAIARTVGRINDRLDEEPYILIGPGRWASSNPQLGVPVQYGEIIGAEIIIEVSTAGFSPELSYGTHFYAEMVASEVLYLPFYESDGDWLNRELLERQEAVSRDEFVTHFSVPSGLDVFADGAGHRAVIALTSTR
jgi:hypothetical protein